MSLPLSVSNAFRMSAAVATVTYANPFGFPVSCSMGKRTSRRSTDEKKARMERSSAV
jgi:hypothetical protein